MVGGIARGGRAGSGDAGLREGGIAGWGGIIAIHGSRDDRDNPTISRFYNSGRAWGGGGCSEYRILRGLPLLRAVATVPCWRVARRRCRRPLINLDVQLPLASDVASWQDGSLATSQFSILRIPQNLVSLLDISEGCSSLEGTLSDSLYLVTERSMVAFRVKIFALTQTDCFSSQIKFKKYESSVSVKHSILTIFTKIEIENVQSVLLDSRVLFVSLMRHQCRCKRTSLKQISHRDVTILVSWSFVTLRTCAQCI